jgi:transcriptional regulator with XRE-family HTH domain
MTDGNPEPRPGVPDDLDRRVGRRIKTARRAEAWTLDDLARRAGVSRAMISKIERGEASATAVLLAKLAAALGLSLAALFEPSVAATRPSPLRRRGERPVWRDPATGYVRSNVSPGGPDAPFEIVEVEFPPGAEVRFPPWTRFGIDQLIWVLDGEIDIRLGETSHKLSTGDCLRLSIDQPLTYSNRSGRVARYAVVLKTAKP